MCDRPHFVAPGCTICERGYTGDDCDATFAQHFGSEYNDYTIAFVACTVLIGSTAVIQTIRLIRARGLRPMNVQKFVHFCIVFGSICAAIRASDPLGYRIGSAPYTPYTLTQLCIDCGTGALFSATIAVFFTWVRIIRILSLGILSSRDGALPSAAAAAGEVVSSGSHHLFQQQVLIQSVMWIILIISSIGQSSLSPSWIFRIIKLAKFCVWLILLMITGWTVGVKIWRDLGQYQLLLLQSNNTSTGTGNSHSAQNGSAAHTNSGGAGGADGTSGGGGGGGGGSAQTDEISRILKLLAVFTVLACGAIAEQLVAIVDEAIHQYDVHSNPTRAPSSLWTGPVNPDILQFCGMTFLLVFFRRISGAANSSVQRSEEYAPGREPLLDGVDPFATVVSDDGTNATNASAPTIQHKPSLQPSRSTRVGPNSGSLRSGGGGTPRSGAGAVGSGGGGGGARGLTGVGSGRRTNSMGQPLSGGGTAIDIRSEVGSGGGGGVESPIAPHSYARSSRPRPAGSVTSGGRSRPADRMDGSLAEHYSMRSDAFLTLISNSMEQQSLVPVPGTKDYVSAAANPNAAPPTGVVVATAPGMTTTTTSGGSNGADDSSMFESTGSSGRRTHHPHT